MKPIAIDDFCAVRSLANVTFSPEGTSACFTVSQAKKEKNCYESRLYLLKGGRVRALTGGGKESSFCYLDENTVLFAGDREGEKEPSLTSRFYKIALDGGEADLAYTFPIPVSQVFPLKNGDLLVVGSTFPGFEDLYKGDRKLVKAYFDDKKENEDYEVISQLPWWWNGGTYTRGAYESLFYYDAKKKSLTRLTDAGFNVSDVQLAEDQKTVYFSLLDVSVPRPAHFGGQDLYRIDLASRRQKLVVKSRPDFVIATYALGKSFLLVMAADGKFGMNTDCDFYKLDYETLAVTHFNDAMLRGKYVAQPDPLNLTAGDHEVHGFILKPMDFEAGKKYPVIFDIHGGPKTVYGPVFYHEMQYWASRGYFVIFCNPTGSDGRGAFMDIRGKYGTVDFDDLMAFCDAALAKYPEMDADNLFETGGSYGGFMTNWIIGHTDRFRACASQRSISNWTSFYGVSDIGPDFSEDQCGSTIWPDVEKFWWHSPMKYADKVKTPTLFLHSLEDYRCPVDQGYQMYSALIAHGVESRLVLFRGENHELSRSGKPKHRIRRLNEITGWFEQHKG
ncbi:MAG: S9 family peptidase [Oscillospiraceae bacterium]|jgi:dipeptidyl aminopeptidase/acylaminoacyl peptidase|nr:S9 family peptidase [Oscillospiraceae bacterium]